MFGIGGCKLHGSSLWYRDLAYMSHLVTATDDCEAGVKILWLDQAYFCLVFGTGDSELRSCVKVEVAVLSSRP